MVLCPQCRIPIFAGKCPNCGKDLSAAKDEVETPSDQPLTFDVLTSARESNGAEDPDWRQELKKKLDEHTARKRGEASGTQVEQAKPVGFSDEPEEPEVEEEKPRKRRPLFDYKLKQISERKNPPKEPPAPKRSPKLRGEERPIFENSPHPPPGRPVFKDPVREAPSQRPEEPSHAVRQPDPRTIVKEAQGLKPTLPISFEPVIEEEVPEVVEEELEPTAEAEEEFSREILFSRFLAGIIDLAIPVLLGLGFTFVSSWILDFDIFMTDYLFWVGLLATVFYLFNSSFFLLSSGQTPGMSVTDLEITGEESDSPASMGAILLRVVLFLPVAVSVVGLAWAVVDPLRRCVHDVLSGTRIHRVAADQKKKE